jgi:thiamine biosynthesis lipoprotein
MTSEADRSLTAGSRLSGRSRVLLSAGLLLLVALTVHRLFLADVSPSVREFSGATMGTMFTVKFVVPGRVRAAALAELRDSVEARLDRVNGLMSTYDSTSELSRFNRTPTTDPYPLSPPTIAVLRISQAVSQATGGAFDVTVGPLVDSWGFGADGRPERVPQEDELVALAARVGFRKLSVDAEGGSVTKAHPELEVDLSAVAKGYAVDRVADALFVLGYDAYLVEIGGELRGVGVKPGNEPWRVGVEAPDPGSRSIYTVIELTDASIATSGDYRNFYEEDGIRYSHLIDPRTSRSTPYTGASVTVLHASAAVADAWATALSVMGPTEGPEVAEREGIAAFFIMRGDGAFETIATGSFPEPGSPDGPESGR